MQGSRLVMSIYLEFENHMEMHRFQADVGASFGTIVGASASIESAASRLDISGSVTLQAFQQGGEPGQLSKILGAGPDREYYLLTCSIQKMDDCTKAASSLLNYAQNVYPTQYSVAKGLNLTPFGEGKITTTDMKYINLKRPETLVNATVRQNRLDLADTFSKYQSYKDKFDELVDGYPGGWDTNSKVYTALKNLQMRANHNINRILSVQNPEDGALGCFIKPDQCPFIASAIMNQVVTIDNSSLTALNPIQYMMPISYGAGLFVNGDSATSLSLYTHLASESGYHMDRLNSASWTEKELSMDLQVTTDSGDADHFWCNGPLTSIDGATYKGQCCDNEYCFPETYTRHLSPFFFGPQGESAPNTVSQYTGEKYPASMLSDPVVV